MAQKNPNGIQSLGRAFRILEYIGDHDNDVSLSTLSKKLGLPPSTVHRFLASLMSIGYVIQDEFTGHYGLGLKFLSLSSSILATLDERRIAQPTLAWLVEQTGETANLVVRDGLEVVYVEKAEPKSMVRAFSRIGKRAPAHATGVGKLFLSQLPAYEIADLYQSSELPQLTPNTISTLDRLVKELARIQQQGYALDLEECEVGARCVAAPVVNHVGKIICAISISGPTNRLTKERMVRELVPIVQKGAYDLSQKLGYDHRQIRKPDAIKNT